MSDTELKESPLLYPRKLLFHGSRALFDEFDPKYALSGEGFNNFDGWNLIDSLKGAYYHAESRLNHIPRPGLVYVCLVPLGLIVENIEYTDGHYHGSTVGVRYCNSSAIQIVEVLEIEHLHDELVGSPKKYVLENTKAVLSGRCFSFLRKI